MKINRRRALMSLVAAAMLAGPASAADTIRVGLPTKTYWPTTIAETAVRQKLFEKEGIQAELTVYRSGAETFEGMAAGAADIILDPPSLVSAGRKKGVMSRIVANAAMGNFGWQLMVPTKSTLDVKDLNGKKVAITAAGSGSDLLALWTIQDKKIDFTRVPVGGGGLVPNLLAGNVEQPWSIRRSASRSRSPAKPGPSSTTPPRFRRTSRQVGSCSTSSPRRSRS